MPIVLYLDRAIGQWMAKYGRRMTYTELARRAGMSLATLHRLKNGELHHPDLRKINALCKVLECEPGDIIKRLDTELFGGSPEEALAAFYERQEFEEELSKLEEDEHAEGTDAG